MTTTKRARDRNKDRNWRADHIQDCPFPVRTTSGRLVLDESCYCSHYRTDHIDTLAFGHGACEVRECKCRKFTWSKFVEAYPARPKKGS